MPAYTPRRLRPLLLLLAIGCGGGRDGAPSEVPVIVLSQATLDLTEGTPETLTVVLDAAPPGNVSVALSSAGRVTMLPTTLDFTPADFATPKSVIVTPVQDVDLVAGNDTVVATATGLVTVKVPVTIAEDDSQAVVLDSTSLTIVEGDSATYGIKLAYQPTGSASVTIMPSDTMVVVTPTTVDFTPADYATPKSVTVRAKQDVDLVGDTLHVVATVTGGAFASLPVEITDDDQQAIQVDTDIVEVTEGDSAQLGVRLAFQPGGNRTILASSLVPTAATVHPSSLNFTSANWDTYQYLTVSGSQDADLLGTTVSVRLSGATVPDKDVPVHVTDDDSQAFVTSVDTVVVTEGATVGFTLALAFQPSSAVEAALAVDTIVATVSPSITSTFTAGNYSTGFTIQVTGTQDANTTDEATTLTISAPGIPDRHLVVIVHDDD